MGPTDGRRSRTNVISDEGLAGSQGVVRASLEARLNPVKDGAESTPGGKRSVKVQGDDDVGGRGFRNSKRDIGSGLGVCSRDKVRSVNSEQSKKTHQLWECTAWSLLLSH